MTIAEKKKKMAEKLSLLSSDTRFPFYRSQGLDLIEY